jgi:hypothetical protein
MRFLDWCIKAHRDTNHYYDEYLPYEFHLRMTMQVAKDFVNVVPSNRFHMLLDACAGHDLIEDTRQNYNSVLEALKNDGAYTEDEAKSIAEIIFAVTNETGRNRAERANDHYYWKIFHTPLASFVKLCDRIANVRYSVLTKSPQLLMYKREHEHFIKKMELGYPSLQQETYQSMTTHLTELLNK